MSRRSKIGTHRFKILMTRTRGKCEARNLEITRDTQETAAFERWSGDQTWALGVDTCIQETKGWTLHGRTSTSERIGWGNPALSGEPWVEEIQKRNHGKMLGPGFQRGNKMVGENGRAGS